MTLYSYQDFDPQPGPGKNEASCSAVPVTSLSKSTTAEAVITCEKIAGFRAESAGVGGSA